jgi:hypothetical protein
MSTNPHEGLPSGADDLSAEQLAAAMAETNPEKNPIARNPLLEDSLNFGDKVEKLSGSIAEMPPIPADPRKGPEWAGMHQAAREKAIEDYLARKSAYLEWEKKQSRGGMN